MTFAHSDLDIETWSGRSQQESNKDIITSRDAATPALAAIAAYNADAKFVALENTKMVIDSSYDIKDVINWAQNAVVANNATFTLALEDGFYDVAFYADITGNIRIEAKNAPIRNILATSYSYNSPDGNLYQVQVGLSSALPDYVVPGYAIGIQNPNGNNSASACAGGHIITSIAADRMSFSFEMTSYGPALVSPTLLDSTLRYGLAANTIVIPTACFKANTTAPGWNGSGVEGFFNVLKGGSLILRNIAIAYAGQTSEHDIINVNGYGSRASLEDYVVIAGTGDKVLRASHGGSFYVYRSCLGCGTTGQEIYQGTVAANISFLRCSLSGGSKYAITPTIDARASITQSILASSNIGLEPTYDSASIQCTTSTIVNCNHALYAAKGTIQVGDDVKIEDSTYFASISSGRVVGNPTLTNVTNVITPNIYINGGYWQRDSVPIERELVSIEDSHHQYIGSYTVYVDFPSINSHSFSDCILSAEGVAINDIVHYARSGAGEPSQAIIYQAFVSAANTITLRAFNVGTTVVDKTPYTARFNVYRVSST